MLDKLIAGLQEASNLLKSTLQSNRYGEPMLSADKALDIDRYTHAVRLFDRVIDLPVSPSGTVRTGVWVRIDPQSHPDGPLPGQYATSDPDAVSWWIHCG